MPEIAECYSIASKLPDLEIISEIVISKFFYKDINKNKNIQKHSLVGSNISKPFAYGKSIWFPLFKNGQFGFLVSQLGMSGAWSVGDNLNNRNSKHDHFIIKGKNNTIKYNDPRRFGKINLYWGNSYEELKTEIIKEKKWGIDPLNSSPKEISLILQTNWVNKNQEIKKLLLDQNLIFGIGNYLASEILFKSKIGPFLKPKQLTKDDFNNLASSIKFIIKKALASGGFSFAGGYVLPDGSLGDYHNKVLVYGKNVCPLCKINLTKSIVAGRITYWCSACQKK